MDDEARLRATYRGDAARERFEEVPKGLRLRLCIAAKPTRSSADEMGEERAGESVASPGSSVSEVGLLSSEAAKLLEISGSEMYAYEDGFEPVDVVEVVRVRGERREVRGSSCQTEVLVSISPYKRP